MQEPRTTAMPHPQPGAARRIDALPAAAPDGLESRVAVRDSMRQAVARRVRARGAERLGMPPAHEGAADLAGLLRVLRSTVTTFVAERREASVPVERVLPEVKALVRQVEDEEGWHDPADTLMAQVVRWAIEAYYDGPQLQHVPRFY